MKIFFWRNKEMTNAAKQRIHDTAQQAYDADRTYRPNILQICSNCRYFKPKYKSITTGNCHGLPAQVVVRAGRSDSTNGVYDSAYPRTTAQDTCSLFVKKER